MHPNYMVPLEHLDVDGTTGSVTELAPGVRIGIGDVSGELSYRGDEALHLETRETDGPYEWAEISVALTDPAWRTCRRIFIQSTASANVPVEIVPALRLFSADRFHDLFGAVPLSLTPHKTAVGCVFELSPKRMAHIERVDLQLFLSSREHSLTLFALSAAGTH